MASSIGMQVSFAPPCARPQSEAMPAAMQAKGLAWELAAMRTVEVEAFCSWSMWRKKASMGFATTGLST